MTMQILKIAVYGFNGKLREISFDIGKVNIITGASKKGKSSLLDIVEYCLGSSECNVAAGYVRNSVAWYGLLLQFPDTRVFIARAAPLQGGKSNSSARLDVGVDIDVPEASELIQTTNIDAVVGYLTSKVGVPENITEVPDHQTRSPISVGFKHSRYYLFQNQDEIAAKKILFHRQAEPHLPQAIKDTLPYFLGAADDGRLAELERLRALKQKKSVLAKKIREVESLKGDGLGRGYALLSEAAEVGIYSGNLIPSDEQLLVDLRKVAAWAPGIAEEGPDISRVAALEDARRHLQEKKAETRMKLKEAHEYRDSFHGYDGALIEQGKRLRSIGLFEKLHSAHSSCPICDSQAYAESNYVSALKAAAERVSRRIGTVERGVPRIGSLISGLESEDGRLAAELKKVRLELEGVRAAQVDSASRLSDEERRWRVVGRISLYLDSVDWNQDISHLVRDLDELGREIEQLEERLSPDVLQEKLASQLNCIAEDMTRWARDLGLEHSEHRIRLDVKQLTVVADTPHGPTPLYQMGSGENWVGYHLVTYLALAKWFIEQRRPVGRFVFFDQPTQVYFPSDSAVTGGLEEIGRDEDRAAVRRMFEWIFRVTAELSPNLQVIITDHADIQEDWFQAAVRDVKWRGEHALIPRDWYE